MLSGETIDIGVWVMGPTAVGVWLAVRWNAYDGTNVYADYVDVTSAGAPSIRPDGWTLMTARVPVPAGAVGVTPYLRTYTGYVTAGASVYVTAWQVGSSLGVPEPAGMQRMCTIPDPGAGWRNGGGGPYVVADVDGDTTYSAAGMYDADFVLYET